jgi:hypothetical protein
MKKIILLLAFTSLIITRCGIRNFATIADAKYKSDYSAEEFLKNKFDAVEFLFLTDSQKQKCSTLFTLERNELIKIDLSKEFLIAPIIYNSEIKFREALNNEQLERYVRLHNQKKGVKMWFLNDKQLASLKEKYIDK